MKKILVLIVVSLIVISCSNSRDSIPISLEQFEEAISAETVERIIFHSDRAVEIKYLKGDDLYQITTDKVLPKELKEYVGDILKKHDSKGIIFEYQTRFIDNFF